MENQRKKRPYKKIALAFSLCLMVLWGVLGTGASLAWFADETPDINNIFQFANFELTVSHQLTDGKWEKVDHGTELFDRNARYEPGYVQVVYLKVENNGDVPFEFYTAVNINGYVSGVNANGQSFNLQDYLLFGITVSDTPEAMKSSVSDREAAKAVANMNLHDYHTKTAVLQPGDDAYIALVVRMPESADNNANYRGTPEPAVELGITVKADQIKK